MEHISTWSVLTVVIYVIKKNTETLLEASRELCLEENTEETKYMVTYNH